MFVFVFVFEQCLESWSCMFVFVFVFVFVFDQCLEGRWVVERKLTLDHEAAYFPVFVFVFEFVFVQADKHLSPLGLCGEALHLLLD